MPLVSIGLETSSFASEFIATKTCCEYIRGLRYKLQMMGIPCHFPAFIYGDNQSVLANSMKPFSVLKKKSCSIAYHFVREGVAKNEWRTNYISTHVNQSSCQWPIANQIYWYGVAPSYMMTKWRLRSLLSELPIVICLLIDWV